MTDIHTLILDSIEALYKQTREEYQEVTRRLNLIEEQLCLLNKDKLGLNRLERIEYDLQCLRNAQEG